MPFNGTGSNVTSLNASNISSGTVATARLGSGTADATTFLRGDGTWSAPGSFPSGTVMIFAQTSAPTGWTKLTNLNDYALRVVSGTASTGGSVAFSTAFASGLSAGATTLNTTQIPSHTHGFTASVSNISDVGFAYNGLTVGRSVSGGTTGAAGGGGSHNHSLPSFAVQYIDVIRASKD